MSLVRVGVAQGILLLHAVGEFIHGCVGVNLSMMLEKVFLVGGWGLENIRAICSLLGKMSFLLG